MTKYSYISFQREHTWGFGFDLSFSPQIKFNDGFVEPAKIYFSTQILCFAVYATLAFGGAQEVVDEDIRF